MQLSFAFCVWLGDLDSADNALFEAKVLAGALCVDCRTTHPGPRFVAPGDLDSADNVLSEANVLDPEDPLAWGLLALVALRQGRQVRTQGSC